MEYLPSLNMGRFHHACSSFISDSGETVGFIWQNINTSSSSSYRSCWSLGEWGCTHPAYWTPQRSWSLLVYPGGLSPPPGFLLRDMDCELRLLTMWSTHLVRTVSIDYNTWNFILLFIIRRNWRISFQRHPLLQQCRGDLAASWTDDGGERRPRSRSDRRCFPRLPLMMKTTWALNRNIMDLINIYLIIF